ncbi:MAG: hypothetical protein KGL43_00345 [Burkholderiales bacterium]|nr:hypothetical protein [Burkholderiales bacterium]MDE2398331.1 hypothetical protein [Burkholderiales bacterium]MDE2452016.1 hypothetical protein [Burkholderiales bacterium]
MSWRLLRQTAITLGLQAKRKDRARRTKAMRAFAQTLVEGREFSRAARSAIVESLSAAQMFELARSA